jgi:uncharacterized membrane protein (UPF0127 family)
MEAAASESSSTSDRRTAVLGWAIAAVLLLGIGSFVVQGANRPADPVLLPPSELFGSATPPDLPGDPHRVPLEGVGEVAVEVTNADGEVVGWCLLHADSDEQRKEGLMGVEDLQRYPGMIFTYDEDRTSGFWMRNTPMPLSIAWFDAAGTLVDTADMEPCGDSSDCRRYTPSGAYRSAIEVPRGLLDELGVGPGTRIAVTTTGCAPRS